MPHSPDNSFAYYMPRHKRAGRTKTSIKKEDETTTWTVGNDHVPTRVAIQEEIRRAEQVIDHKYTHHTQFIGTLKSRSEKWFLYVTKSHVRESTVRRGPTGSNHL